MTAIDLATASLTDLEARIERGLETFVDVGLALMEIRERRLYRESHGTFEDYCRERWGFTDRRARQLMDVAQTGNMFPVSNARQAAALAPLVKDNPDEARELIEDLREEHGDRLTARHIEDAVRDHQEVIPAEQWQQDYEQETAKERARALYSSDSPEWFTPSHIIDRTEKLLGRIDLDPCSNSRDEPNVPAAQHFTAEHDGLAQEWHGLVYMNPPYGGGIGNWVRKLVDAHRAGNVPEAIALVPARTDTAWFAQLREWPRCFISGRLKFSGHDNSAPFPSAVVYLGERVDDFVAAFGDVGDVFVRYQP